MFWNVNALTRLSFTERGEILGAEELFPEATFTGEAAEAMAGVLPVRDRRCASPRV